MKNKVLHLSFTFRVLFYYLNRLLNRAIGAKCGVSLVCLFTGKLNSVTLLTLNHLLNSFNSLTDGFLKPQRHPVVMAVG